MGLNTKEIKKNLKGKKAMNFGRVFEERGFVGFVTILLMLLVLAGAGVFLAPLSRLAGFSGYFSNPWEEGEAQAQGLTEIVEKRTENSKTFDLGNNKRALEVSIGAIHYKDNYANPNEPWKDIDLTWKGNKITKAPYILEVDIANKSLTMQDKHTGAVTTIKLDSVFDKALPQAKIPLKAVEVVTSNNRITWTEIVDGVDLIIEAGPESVKFARVVKHPKASHKARFIVESEGIPIRYQATDKTGEPVEVQVTKDGNLVTEDITVGDDQYPITIDPTLTIQPSAKDTSFRYDYPTLNYGTQTDQVWVTRRDDVKARAIFEFNISSVPAGTINSATLSLYYWSGFEPVVGSVIWAYRLTRTDWVEAEATWNIYKTGNNWTIAGGDFTTDTPAGASTTVPSSTGVWMYWPITGLVQDARANRNDLLELLLKFETEPSGGGQGGPIRWYPREYTGDTSLRPKVVIDYTEANNAPTVDSVSLNSGSSITLTEATTKAVSATGTVSDADGYADISSVQGKLYRSGVGSSCTLDNDNCYEDTSCATSNCSGNTCDYACDYNLQFFADPTDTGTYATAQGWDTQKWEAWVKVIDSASASSTATNSAQTVDVNTLTAFNITGSITYDALNPGSNMANLTQTVTASTTGNVPLDLQFRGDAMTSDGNEIAATNQKFSTTTNAAWADGIGLTGTYAKHQVDLSKPTSTPSQAIDTVYWGWAVPASTPSGSYTGTNYLNAVED